MKNKTRTAILALTICLVISVFSGCSGNTTTAPGASSTTASAAVTTAATSTKSNLLSNINLASTYPCVNKKVSAEIAFMPSDGSTNFDVNTNWMVQYFKNVTNMDIKWTKIEPSGAKERVTLMLNSGDLPDAIQGYSFNTSDIVQYGIGDELFMPINDLLKYCPELSKVMTDDPTIKTALTATDGNIYGFPALSNVYSYLLRFFIDTDWLKAVNLKNPTTLDELKAMLIAFRDNDANGNGKKDEIPWGGSWSKGGSERNLIFAAYGYITQKMGNVAIDYSGTNPKICYIPYSANYKTYLKYMNNLWQEKLLDSDMFTQDETQAQASVLEGNIGMIYMSAPYVYDPKDQDDWIAVTAMVDQKGDKPVFPNQNKVMNMANFVISAEADEEIAAALANFADGYYSLETYALCTYGPEAGTALDTNGWGHYFDAEKNTILYKLHPNATSAWNHRTTYLTFWNVPGMVLNGYDPYRLAYAKKYPNSAIGQQFKNGIVSRTDEISQQQNQSPYYAAGVPDFFMKLSDLSRVNELTTPLDDYVTSMEAKFITGASSIDAEFDTFIKTLESYGVKEYMEIYSKYYTGIQSK